MKRILLIESSPRGESSVSRKVAWDVIQNLSKKLGPTTVTARDLSREPLPHVGGNEIAAYFTPPSAENDKVLARSNAAVKELHDSDIVVIATPMWNFGIPSSLKAWIDHVVRAGKTFSFGPTGPQGLLKNKQVYVVISSGSVFSEGPFKSWDFVVPYLTAVFSFIGLTDVKFIRAEGLNDPKNMEQALEKTRAQIAEAV